MELQARVAALAEKSLSIGAKRRQAAAEQAAANAQSEKQKKAAQWNHIKTDMPELAEFMTGFSAKTADLFGPGKKAFAAVETFEGGKSYITGEFAPSRVRFDGKLRAIR